MPAAKLIFASARDRLLPEMLGRLHYRRKTPDNAMFLQASTTTFFIIFGGGFRGKLRADHSRSNLHAALLNFMSVACWTFYLVTVLGLLVLRVKEPHLERPYRTWLVTPIVFCGVSLIQSITDARYRCFCCLCLYLRHRWKRVQHSVSIWSSTDRALTMQCSCPPVCRSTMLRRIYAQHLATVTHGLD